jgi:hypothetical protein
MLYYRDNYKIFLIKVSRYIINVLCNSRHRTLLPMGEREYKISVPNPILHTCWSLIFTSEKSSNLAQYLLKFHSSVPHSSISTAAVIPQLIRPFNQTGIHSLQRHTSHLKNIVTYLPTAPTFLSLDKYYKILVKYFSVYWLHKVKW